MPDKPAAAPRLDDLKFAANLCSSNENLSSGMCPTSAVGVCLWEQVVDGSDHAIPPESAVFLVLPRKHLPVLVVPTRAHPSAPARHMLTQLLLQFYHHLLETCIWNWLVRAGDLAVRVALNSSKRFSLSSNLETSAARSSS